MKNNENKKDYHLDSNIKYLRTSYKLSQKQLGNIFGYSDTTISNWEKGTRIPESLDLPRIANYFKVNIDDLMSCDMRLSKKYSNISEVKTSINNLPPEDMNNEGKDTLIKMVDTLHNLSKKG